MWKMWGIILNDWLIFNSKSIDFIGLSANLLLICY